MYARGKPCSITKHAYEGMAGERNPIRYRDVILTLEGPTTDDGHTATRSIGRRTIIVRYNEYEERVVILGVSATRSRLPP